MSISEITLEELNAEEFIEKQVSALSSAVGDAIAINALSGGVEESEMREVIDWVGLRDRIRHRVGSYSHGMRQRLALAQAAKPRRREWLL